MRNFFGLKLGVLIFLAALSPHLSSAQASAPSTDSCAERDALTTLDIALDTTMTGISIIEFNSELSDQRVCQYLGFVDIGMVYIGVAYGCREYLPLTVRGQAELMDLLNTLVSFNPEPLLPVASKISCLALFV